MQPCGSVTFQFLIAMIAHAINERMARRLDYVQEEVRVLRETLGTFGTVWFSTRRRSARAVS